MSEPKLRPAKSADIPLVISSWMMSYRHASPCENRDLYEAEQKQLIYALLKHSQVFVVCDDEDQDVVVAWACFGEIRGERYLHYVYVKEAFRKMGLAGMLLDAIEMNPTHGQQLRFSHRTDKSSAILAKVPRERFTYNPWILTRFHREESPGPTRRVV